MKELLTELAGLWGPPGREEQVAAALQRRLGASVDSARTDALGNLLAVRRPRGAPSGQRVLLLAHMDGPGGIVTQITEQGWLKFQPVGGLSLVAARGQRVRFRDGLAGVLDGEALAEPKDLQAANSWIDIGAAGREQAAARVREGEFFVLDQPAAALGDRVAGPNLNNRAGCAVLVQVLQELGDSPHEVHAAFTVQGQVAPRGALTGAFQVQPDLAVVLAVGAADAGKGTDFKLGAGPGLRLREQDWVLRPGARAALVAAAAAAGVAYQPEIRTAGTSAAGGVQAVAGGIPVAVISLPGRYLGTPVEVVDPADLRQAADWLLALLRQPLALPAWGGPD